MRQQIPKIPVGFECKCIKTVELDMALQEATKIVITLMNPSD